MGAREAAIHLFTGKGGVGKSVACTALALAYAHAGKRVLICELHGRDRIAQLLGVEPRGYELREVFDDVSLIDINVRDAMREYVLLTLHFDALYRAVFDNRLVRSFVDLVPSLGELVMLGKIWYEAQRQKRDRSMYDAVLVDAPATGHALALLRAPKTVFASVPPGPMRDNAKLLQSMLERREQTVIHIVTTPEDMPVTEALELRAAVEALNMHLGPVVINQRLAPLDPDALACVGRAASLAKAAAALQRREAARRCGEQELERLPHADLQTAITLPPVGGGTMDLHALQTLAHAFAPYVQRHAS